MEVPFIVLGSLILIGIITVGAIFLIKRKNFKGPENGKYPKGHFLNKGIAIGLPLGIPLGLAMGNIAFGLPIGLMFGYVIGTHMEEKNRDKIRPLTPEEEERKKKIKVYTIALLILGALVLASVFIYYWQL